MVIPATSSTSCRLDVLVVCFLICTGLSAGFHLPRPTASSRRQQTRRWISTPTAPSTSQDSTTLVSITEDSSSSSFSKPGDFSKFDFNNHWYPVGWVKDLPSNKPIQVSVFDVDYAVAKIDGDDNVVAMVDRCPHKSAALSQGRITKSAYIQCSYHGWSFDGKDGSCKEIPQVVNGDGASPPNALSSSRLCGISVPAMVVQGMVYIFPGEGGWEKALLAPEPPRVEEADEEGWRVLLSVREFPIDWSILLENIMDPDHGLFAHGNAGFDLYTATVPQGDQPQTLVERMTDDGRGWTMTAMVDARPNLVNVNKNLTAKKKEANLKQDDGATAAAQKNACLTFVAPNTVYYSRRDKDTGKTTFINSFYVTPTGTGRSRFHSASYYKAPFSVPRWFAMIGLMNFLDQDTYLLATQQAHVLKFEAEAVRKMQKEEQDHQKQHGHQNSSYHHNTRMRRTKFNLATPSESFASRLCAFWDATLCRAPNRISTLLALVEKDEGTAGNKVQPRSIILDREEQHLKHCPDSQAVVRNCDRIRRFSKVVLWATAVAKFWTSNIVLGSSNKNNKLTQTIYQMLGPKLLAVTWSIGALAIHWAKKIKGEFFFKYGEELHDKDLYGIPKVWRDV